jgi:hypothetical protein
MCVVASRPKPVLMPYAGAPRLTMAATATEPRSIAAYAASDIDTSWPPRAKSRKVGKFSGLPSCSIAR